VQPDEHQAAIRATPISSTSGEPNLLFVVLVVISVPVAIALFLFLLLLVVIAPLTAALVTILAAVLAAFFLALAATLVAALPDRPGDHVQVADRIIRVVAHNHQFAGFGDPFGRAILDYDIEV